MGRPPTWTQPQLLAALVPLFHRKGFAHTSLKDVERVLPVWMGFETGLSIWLSVSGRRMPRPMTHDLMRQLMETVGFKVESVAVNRLAEGFFYGEIALSHDEQSYRVEARPSDAIALATRLEAPIYVAHPVLKKVVTSPNGPGWISGGKTSGWGRRNGRAVRCPKNLSPMAFQAALLPCRQTEMVRVKGG